MIMSSRAVLAAGSLALLAFVLGVAGDRVWLAHRPSATIVLDTEHAERFHTLLNSLGLSDSQRVAVDNLLSHYQANVERAWQSMQPRLQTTMDSARQDIEALLDEGQLATFQQWLASEHQLMHRTEHPGLRH